MQLKIVELFTKFMTNREYVNELEKRDPEQERELYLAVNKKLDFMQAFGNKPFFVASELSVMEKRISDLEEQVKTLLIRLEEKNAG